MEEKLPAGYGHLYFAYSFVGDEYTCENIGGEFWAGHEAEFYECLIHSYYLDHPFLHKDGTPFTKEEMEGNYDSYLNLLIYEIQFAKSKRNTYEWSKS